MKDTFDLQNPWRRPEYTFPDEPYIHRGIFDRLLRDLTCDEITVVLGSRQVGKTFLINKLIEKLLADGLCDPRQIFYFNFDAFNLLELIGNDRDFLDFIKYYGMPGKRPYIFLDEAQRIPEVGLLLKRYYDLKMDLKFIISGSSSLQIKSQVKETLAGRKHLFELYPITYGEFLRFKGLKTPDDPAAVVKFEFLRYRRVLEEFVIFGGYPGIVRLNSPEQKVRLLKEIYNSYVQKDISDFLKIEDIAGFNRLVNFVAYQAGGLCKTNEVAKNTRLTRHFVEKYLFALEQTYVAAFLRPYFVNLGKAVVKTPKLYFCDTGIRNSVFGQFEPLDKRQDSGMLVENFVFSELLKAIDKDRLWFYRTSAGSEVDFLVISADQTVPVEVKHSISRQKSVPKIFQTLARNTSIKEAVVVTRDHLHREQRGGMQIFFLPAHAVYNLEKLVR